MWLHQQDCCLILLYSVQWREEILKSVQRESAEVGRPHFFFLLNIQSMRSTACVKVQIIWTCTSRWSGSTTSTARTCQRFRSTYLNIQREYLLKSILPRSPLWPRDWCCLCTLFGLQLVWAICHHVAGWEWRSLQRFSTWSPGEGQKRRGNCFLSAFFTL